MSDIIQSLWIGDQLSRVEQLCINSFSKNGSEFHLYTYNKVDNVPKEACIKDANTIIPKSEIFKNKRGSYALFADWFRFEMIYKKGGFYVDMDMICLKPFHFENEPIVFGRESADSISNAIMKFPENHEICRFMADICKHPNTILPYDSRKEKIKKLKRKYLKGNKRSNIHWGETGPLGFTRHLNHLNLFNQAKHFTCFFPVSPCNWMSFFDDTFEGNMSFFNNSYTAHLWNEFLRKNHLSKNSQFHKNSFFEQINRKYLS